MLNDEPLGTLDERLREVWTDAARSGTTMPSEPALAASLSMGRPAVREALVRLEERGYIHRRKGADTVVNASILDIPARFDRQLDKAELIAAMGRVATLDVLSVERSAVTSAEAETYDLEPGAPLLRMHKRWCADGVPVMLARDAIPIRQTAALDDLHASRSMFDLAEDVAGERAEWEIVWPGSDGLSAQDAWHVERPTGEPVLTQEVTGVGRSGGVCYWAAEVHLRGAFRYAMVRRTRPS